MKYPDAYLDLVSHFACKHKHKTKLDIHIKDFKLYYPCQEKFQRNDDRYFHYR